MFHIALVEPEIPPNTGNIARLCAATFFFAANGGGVHPNFVPVISPTANIPNSCHFNLN